MEEALRVKIVVDSTEANNSLKQVTNQTNKLSGDTNATAQSVQKLEKALSGVGMKGIKIAGITSAFAGIGAAIKKVTSSITGLVTSQSIAINNFKRLGTTAKGAMSSTISNLYLTKKDIASGVMNGNSVAQLKQDFATMQASQDKTMSRLFTKGNYRRINRNLSRMEDAFQAGKFSEYSKAFNNLSNEFKAGFSRTITLSDFLKKRLSNLKTVVVMLGKAIKVAFASIPIIALASIAALTKLAFSTSKVGDEIDKNSQKLGMSYEAYQKWGYILERAGLEVNNLKTAMRGLYRNSQGNNADYFKQLGINPEGLSKEKLFEQSVTALQQISDSAERARMAYKLFGQASAEITPLLNMNSQEITRLSYQYDLLGAAMNGGAVRASVNLRDAITDLKAAFQGLKNTLGQVLMPLITDLVVRLTVFIAKVNMVIQALFGVDLEYESVAESSQEVTHQAQETTQAVQKLKTLISGFDELNIFPSQNQGYDLGTFLDELGDYDWGETPSFGEILPQWAIEDLENFRDNILPGIVEKIQDIIDKIDAFKERLHDPAFSEDSPLGGFLNWLIDFNWDNLFGDVDFEHPFSLESLFGEHLAHWIETGEYDWSTTPIGMFFQSLKEEWENVCAAFRGESEPEHAIAEIAAALGRFFRGIGTEWENMGKAFRGEIEGETLLEKLAGFVGKIIRAIKGWDIWKKEWWQGKWQNIKDAWNNSKLKKFFTDAWDGIKTFFGGIANWNIFKKDWWSQKWQKVKDAWNNSKIKKFFTDGWNGVKTFFSGIGNWNIFKKEWWEGKWKTIKTAWNNSKIGIFFNNAWNGIKDWWNEKVKPIFTKDWWTNKFQKIKDGFNGLLIVKFFKGAWQGVKDWWNEKVKPVFTADWWKNKFQKIKDGFNNLLLVKFFTNGWQGVKDWFNEKVKPKFTAEYWKNKFTSIKTGFNNLGIVKFFKGAWTGVTDWFNEKVKPKFTADYWKNVFTKIKTGLENTAIVQTISTKWAAIKKWFSDNIAGIFTKDWWTNKWNKIKDGLANSTLVQGIITKWNAVKKWWNDNVKGIFTKEWWQTKWNKIKEGLEAINLGNVFKGIMNGIISGFENAVNRIIDSVTGPVKLLLVALGVLNEDFQMPHLSIPRLAKGGVVDEATVALVGEYSGAKNNPEIITPESKMQEVFNNSNEAVVNVLVQGFRQIIQAIDENKTEVNIDGMSILKSVNKANNTYKTMTGYSML